MPVCHQYEGKSYSALASSSPCLPLLILFLLQHISRSPARLYLFSSSSFHTFLILSRFSLAASRFWRVRSSRMPRRHMLTLCLASVQLPVTFHRNPWAWHSSSAATTSAQSVCPLPCARLAGISMFAGEGERERESGFTHSFALLPCADADAWCMQSGMSGPFVVVVVLCGVDVWRWGWGGESQSANWPISLARRQKIS